MSDLTDDDEPYVPTEECTCEACTEHFEQAAVEAATQVATLHEAIEAAKDAVNDVHQRRWAAIEAAIRANPAYNDDSKKYDPMNTVKLAKAFLDIIENGIEAVTHTDIINIRRLN
jgi:hypothetical protein